MRSLFSAGLASCLLVAALVSTATAVSYRASLLHPTSGFSGSTVRGLTDSDFVGSGDGSATGNREHALLWQGSSQTLVDLHPIGKYSSHAHGVSGNTQVGLVRNSNAWNDYHAVLWHGTANSAVNLHPIGYASSIAFAATPNSQVGSGFKTGEDLHALLWRGTAASAVDLHPAGYYLSAATAATETHQVGSGPTLQNQFRSHALLWSGTAESVVDLHPEGFLESTARGIFADVQVGTGAGPSTGNQTHALLWRGTARSYYDLNPVDYNSSTANDVEGNMIVGYGAGLPTGGFFTNHALLWFGTAESAVNLHQYLADLPIELKYSAAYAINSDGTIVGDGLDSFNQQYAVVWTPIHGDFDGNLRVDAADYTVWRDSVGQAVVAGSGADGNGDGLVDDVDYSIWKANFGNDFAPVPLATAIPEPGHILLVVSSVSIGGLFLRRGRNFPQPPPKHGRDSV